jgi:hypothetical protein
MQNLNLITIQILFCILTLNADKGWKGQNNEPLTAPTRRQQIEHKQERPFNIYDNENKFNSCIKPDYSITPDIL